MSEAKAKTTTALTKTNRKNQFDVQKNKLKKFSEEIPDKQDLPDVPVSGGLFKLFSYSVKGSDMNDLTEKIQDKMIEQNKLLIKIVKEFHTIYDTFSALDKEYIQGILKSLFAAEEANKKALTGIEGVRVNQESIGNIIGQQSQMIDVLKNFKEDIEKIKHIQDVDELYDTFAPVPTKIKAIETNIDSHVQSIDKLREETVSLHELLEILKQTTNEKFPMIERQISSETDALEKRLIENKETLEEDQVAIRKNISELSEETTYQFELVNKDVSELSVDTTRQLTLVTKDIDKRITENVQQQKATMDTFASGIDNKLNALETTMEQEVEILDAALKNETEQLRESLHEHKELNDHLTQSLKVTKIISFGGIAILFLLVILMISGVF